MALINERKVKMVVEDSVVHLHVFEGDIKSLITQLKNTKDAYDRKVRELKKNLGEFDSIKAKKKKLEENQRHALRSSSSRNEQSL